MYAATHPTAIVLTDKGWKSLAGDHRSWRGTKAYAFVWLKTPTDEQKRTAEAFKCNVYYLDHQTSGLSLSGDL